MWQILKNRARQGYRTFGYPGEEPVFPPRFRGRPVVRNPEAARADAGSVNKAKDPTGAICPEGKLKIDTGRLLFNEDVRQALPAGTLSYSTDYRMAVSKREDLIAGEEGLRLAASLDKKMKKLFGRSLKLREVCAGSCNGCDSEVQVMANVVVFDLSRFGIQFTASPRHADGLLVTGPVTKNMELALAKTYEAVPEPKIVIAVGACAISGGPFRGSPEVNNGVDGLIPVDLYVPGCPPHPFTILDGLLRLLDRLPDKRKS